MNDKPQLTSSMINMLYRCEEQWRRRHGYLFGWNDKAEIIPPGIALIVGISTHKSVQGNLRAKIDTDALLSLEQVKDMARDEAMGLWQKEVRLTDADEIANPGKAKAASVDMSVALSALHATELAPELQPVSVERKWVITLEGFPYDLAGRMDIEEKRVKGCAIRDTKTAARSPILIAAHTSEQLGMYALAKEVCDGETKVSLFLDTLVKTKVPKLVTQVTSRNKHHRDILLRRIERATEVIQKGAFLPANPSDWACSAKFCGYSSTCKFWSGKQ